MITKTIEYDQHTIEIEIMTTVDDVITRAKNNIKNAKSVDSIMQFDNFVQDTEMASLSLLVQGEHKLTPDRIKKLDENEPYRLTVGQVRSSNPREFELKIIVPMPAAYQENEPIDHSDDIDQQNAVIKEEI